MSIDFTGTIIEESLEDKSVLKKMKIISTRVSIVTPQHKSPWLKQWTLHTVEIPAGDAKRVAEELSKALDSKHDWYADYKNDTHHYIIFRGKVFFIDRKSKEQYGEAREYGLSLGIPDYQVNFLANLKK